MSKNLLDTNLIIRFLVDDDPQKVSRVERLLKNKDNTNILLDTIVAEIIWVLSSYYSLKKTEVIEVLNNLLKLSFIKWESRDLLVEAMATFDKTNLDLEDSYNLAFIRKKKIKSVKTFDKHLQKLIGKLTLIPNTVSR